MSVTLLAFGRHGYAVAAANMVATLRAHGYEGPITLHLGEGLRSVLPLWVYDRATVVPLAPEYAANPGWCKVNLPILFDGPDTLYLDVDGVCISDITPLIAQLRDDGRHYLTTVFGQGTSDTRIEYYAWASQAKVKAKHALPDDAVFYGIQSSWCYMRKGDALDKLYQTMLQVWPQWSRHELNQQWGASLPDELIYSIACTLTGYAPSWSTWPVFFGRGHDHLPELRKKHQVLSLMGSGRGRGSVPPRYVECYDAVVRTSYHAMGIPSICNQAERVRRDKYVNFAN